MVEASGLGQKTVPEGAVTSRMSGSQMRTGRPTASASRRVMG